MHAGGSTRLHGPGHHILTHRRARVSRPPLHYRLPHALLRKTSSSYKILFSPAVPFTSHVLPPFHRSAPRHAPLISPPPAPQAMDGSMSLEAALEERLKIINCSPADIKRFIAAHPPASRMAPVGRRGEGPEGGGRDVVVGRKGGRGGDQA